MKIIIDKSKPLSRKNFDAILEALKDKRSIIFQFVDDQDKADFLAEKADNWAKIGAIAGGLAGAVVSVVTVLHTGDVLAAFRAFQACVALGTTLGYGIGLVLGLILWKSGKGFEPVPLFPWFGLAPNRVKLIPA